MTLQNILNAYNSMIIYVDLKEKISQLPNSVDLNAIQDFDIRKMFDMQLLMNEIAQYHNDVKEFNNKIFKQDDEITPQAVYNALNQRAEEAKALNQCAAVIIDKIKVFKARGRTRSVSSIVTANKRKRT